MQHKVVGINGRIGAGKDEFFKGFPEGTIRMAFGDPLKEEVSAFVATHTVGTAASFLLAHGATQEHFEAILRETWGMTFVGVDYAVLVQGFDSKDRVRVMSLVLRNLEGTKNWMHRQAKALSTMHDVDEKKAFRTLMQWWGTEYRRKQTSEGYWIEKTRERIAEHPEGSVVVFTDCRFENEAAYCKYEKEGLVVRVVRGKSDPVGAHASETALDNWDFDQYVLNEGTIEDLHAMAADLYDRVSAL